MPQFADDLLADFHQQMRALAKSRLPEPPKGADAMGSTQESTAAKPTPEQLARVQADAPGEVRADNIATQLRQYALSRPNRTTVFELVRKKCERTYNTNHMIATALTVILLAGIIGTIAIVLAGGANYWTGLCGGMSAASILGFILKKPHQSMSAALRKYTTVVNMQLHYNGQFDICDTKPTADEKLACNDQVWAKMQADLRALGD